MEAVDRERRPESDAEQYDRERVEEVEEPGDYEVDPAAEVTGNQGEGNGEEDAK